jgi:hypothetical protein
MQTSNDVYVYVEIDKKRFEEKCVHFGVAIYLENN